jgi:hypothetical protein
MFLATRTILSRCRWRPVKGNTYALWLTRLLSSALFVDSIYRPGEWKHEAINSEVRCDEGLARAIARHAGPAQAAAARTQQAGAGAKTAADRAEEVAAKTEVPHHRMAHRRRAVHRKKAAAAPSEAPAPGGPGGEAAPAPAAPSTP